MTFRRPKRQTTKPTPQQALVPMPAVATPDTTKRGGGSLGVTLERARKRIGLSPDAVCRDLWLTERELSQYECGLRTPPDGVLERLAELYGLDVDHLNPGTPSALEPATTPIDSDRLWIGWTPVELDRLGATNGARLRAVAQAVRFMRGVSENDSFIVRGDEIDVVADILDTYAPGFVEDIKHWFALDQNEAEELAAKLRHSSDAVKRLPSPTDED